MEALEMGDEWLILNADNYTVTKLNEVGGLCWSMLKEPRTVDSLALELQEHYEISAEEAEMDVEAFLSQLLQLGLVENAN